MNLKIKVCGLRKNNKHQTNELIDGDTYQIINLPKDDTVFLYLTKIQDEVHRFTINYHKQIRSKGSLESILDEVSGIGKIRKKALLKKYGSLKKMRDVDVSDLEEILPKEIAINLHTYLQKRIK